jgi:hypothetical protein
MDFFPCCPDTKSGSPRPLHDRDNIFKELTYNNLRPFVTDRLFPLRPLDDGDNIFKELTYNNLRPFVTDGLFPLLSRHKVGKSRTLNRWVTDLKEHSPVMG